MGGREPERRRASTVGGGNLTLTTAQGDVFGANFTAQNILLQEVPEGPWTVTTKLDHTAITVNGQAAGLVLYGQQNPNYFAKATLQFKTDVDPGTPGNQPGKWIERTLTSNGTLNGSYGGNFPNTGALNPPTSDLWIRARSDGTNVITEFSYDGETFTTAGAAGAGQRVRPERGHQDRPVRQARRQRPGDERRLRLVRRRGGELRGGRRHDAADHHARARPGRAGR